MAKLVLEDDHCDYGDTIHFGIKVGEIDSNWTLPAAAEDPGRPDRRQGLVHHL